MRTVGFGVSIAILFGALGVARPAFGGDDGSDGYDEQEARAARVGKAWLRDGIGAAPRVLKALGSGDAWLEDEARRVLLRWGPRSVSPFLDWLARDRAGSLRNFIQGGGPGAMLSQILCSAGLPWSEDDVDLAPAPAPQSRRDRARANAAFRAALAPIMTALRSKKGRRAQAASLSIIDIAFEDRCPNRQSAFELTGDAMVALIDIQTADDKSNFLLGLSALGPAAKSAVPVAMELLDDSSFRAEAIQLLGGIGPASAPAVPKLRSLLGGEHRVAAARALGDIGPAARATLPDIISLLERSNRNGCDKSPPALVLPVGILGATGEGEAAQAVDALVGSLRACPRNAELTITALGSVGPRGRAAEPALLAFMRDRASPLKLRLLAARSLDAVGAPLSANDQALVSTLEAELRRQNTPAPYVGNQL